MGTGVVAGDQRAVFVQTTSERAFGPTVRVAQHGEQAHREVAEAVIERAEDKLKRVWERDPDAVYELVATVKRDLYPSAAPEPDADSEGES